MNFYNEIDPYCAAWLRNLIKAGLIPDGVVDERSIEDIAPSDLEGFTQCHFFAGLGGWALALREAGIPADYPLWSGSCPCQPFSAAGKGGGFADERHLWPAFDWLIGQCRPDLVLGEQVEGPAGRKWLDLVATDLEGHGYAFGTAVFPAAGVGAPQIRHRTYWVANATGELRERHGEQRAPRWERQGEARGNGSPVRMGHADNQGPQGHGELGRLNVPQGWEDAGQHSSSPGMVSGLAGPDEGQRGRLASSGGSQSDGQAGGWQQGDGGASGDCDAGGMADAAAVRRVEGQSNGSGSTSGVSAQGESGRIAEHSDAGRSSPVNGFWRASDWLYCRDERWRPVEPGTFPLASGAPARVGRLRAYGNAICVPQAVAFSKSVFT